jgi:hypothetical protein
MKKKNKRYIGSSEFKTWNFCPRYWYLMRTSGRSAQGAAIQRGNAYHKKMSKGVVAVKQSQSAFVKALVLGGIICILLMFM